MAMQPARSPGEITPPPAPVRAGPSAVTLRQGSYSQLMRSLRAVRTIPLKDARANPVIQIGQARVNLAPVLNDPQGLPAVAQRLRGQVQLGEVVADTTDLTEVEQGLVIRSFMSYRLRTGTCTDPVKRVSAVRAGLNCFSPRSEAVRAASFANPRDPRYIENPNARTAAVAAANTAAVQTQARVAGYIAQLRAALKTPARRAELVQKYGASEVARFDGLTDEQLTSEAVNAGERRFEQILFIPNANAPIAQFSDKLQRPIISPNVALKNVITPMQAVDKPLDPHVLLAGFTLGRSQEWRKRVEVTIPWCLLGCEETYFGEAYAGYSLGFGLRFPIRTTGTYTMSANGQASVTPTFEPFNGELQDYQETGLPTEKQFKGQELVAEAKAWAGANYSLPVVGSGGVSFPMGKDFTEGLPKPFTAGQFTPPKPKETTEPASVIFRDIDLIAGRANFGFAGAKVFPMLDVSLTSNSLTMDVTDLRTGKKTKGVNSGTLVPLSVDPATQTSNFQIGDPSYNIAFVLTPGVDAFLFVDVGVWEDHWDWKVPFPQLSITVPGGGMTFDCHPGTTCSYNYLYGKDVKKDSAGAKSALKPDDYLFYEGEVSPKPEQTWAKYYAPQIAIWAKGYDNRYFSQCAGKEPCWKALQAARMAAENAMYVSSTSTPQRPFLNNDRITADIKKAGDAANFLARLTVRPYAIRNLAEAYTKGRVAHYSPLCTNPKCQDSLRFVAALFVSNAVLAEKKALPAMDEAEIFAQVSAQSNWEKQYQDAVNQTK